MLLANSTISRLFLGQALYWSCNLIGITLTSLVGLQLAPLNILATLPLALLVLGNLLTVQPLSVFMQRHGRRLGLVLGAGGGIVGGLLGALGVWLNDFTLFCLAGLPLGAYQASAMYYRFAALEAVDCAQHGRASACVIGGGVLAAVVAPSLAIWSQGALSRPFVGAYLMMATLAAIALALMTQLREGVAPLPSRRGWAVVRELLGRPQIRAAIATTAVGHGLMIMIMTATPLAMQFCGLSIGDATQVIQWHMLGMFLPAFVAGQLVDKLGSARVAVLGSMILLTSAGIALSGLAKEYFLLSTFLLGLGWNLMLIAGTTMLASAHSAVERGNAQGLMELSNGTVAASASFAAGALISTLGWSAVNIGILPLVAVVLLTLLPLRGKTLAQHS
nr:MFS transporter [uncultured Pseudomonas sp.]